MLIWGSKGKEKELSQGRFFCPKCGTFTPYKHKQVSKYFTLYLIPLFQIQNLGEFAVCQVCQSEYDAKILEPNNQVTFRLVAATRYDLRHGTSAVEAKSQLVKMGIEENKADAVIGMAQKKLVGWEAGK